MSSRGSSPHARGTLEAVSGEGEYRGIIPACAGNTTLLIMIFNKKRDHPRMRGEHLGQDIAFMQTQGSSPHARGTRCIACACRVGRGIIPACAGNTHMEYWNKARVRDHPRMRGEHSQPMNAQYFNQGSSPHARGTRSPTCPHTNR